MIPKVNRTSFSKQSSLDSSPYSKSSTSSPLGRKRALESPSSRHGSPYERKRGNIMESPGLLVMIFKKLKIFSFLVSFSIALTIFMVTVFLIIFYFSDKISVCTISFMFIYFG